MYAETINIQKSKDITEAKSRGIFHIHDQL